MSHAKRREENAWKMRKQTQKPHGKIKSLAEFANEYDVQHPEP